MKATDYIIEDGQTPAVLFGPDSNTFFLYVQTRLSHRSSGAYDKGNLEDDRPHRNVDCAASKLSITKS